MTMPREIPFSTTESGRSGRTESAASYADVLPAYGAALGKLSRRLMWNHGSGALTIGGSAADMWRDMRATALRNWAILPRVQHVTGDRAYSLYTGSVEDMVSAYRRSGLDLKNQVLVEDYAHRGSKIANLHILSRWAKLNLRFMVLYAAPTALVNFADMRIPVYVATEDNRRLEDLLATRRNTRRFTGRGR